MKLGCVVMAAGRGSRFGSNKLLALFREKPLYRWALEAIPPEEFETVRVVAGCREILQAAKSLGFEGVENGSPELGVSHTIALGLEPLLRLDGVLFLTADQPRLSRETVSRLVAAFGQHPTSIVAAANGGQRGNPCLFPGDLLPELMKLEADRGGSVVIRANQERLILVEAPWWELADCDTEESLKQLEEADACSWS